MDPQVTRLSPRGRQSLRILGFLVLALGLAFTITAMVEFFSLELGDGPPKLSWMGFVGLPLIVVGAAILRFAFLKPLSEVVATETAGAVEVSSEALGRGVGRGLKEGMGSAVLGAGAPTVVKVKCRACGYLESEDAKFCSQCRAPI